MVSINFIILVIKKFIFLLIRFYQIFISKFLNPNKCIFFPSCSHYAIEAIEKKGLIKGICYAIFRILRCNPFNKNFGYDPVEKVTKTNNYKIK